MLSPSEIIEALADAYRAAALAGADMHKATEALETIRVPLSDRDKPYPAWDAIDNQIGRADLDRLVPALSELRHRFEQGVVRGTLERVRAELGRDPQTGWTAWLHSYTEALGFWRLPLCLALVDEPLPTPPAESNVVATTRRGTRLVLHERWPDAYELFALLGHHGAVPDLQRAKLLARAGQVQLYHFQRPRKAKTLFDLATEVAPADAEVICVQGQFCLWKKDLPRAKELLDQAIEADPHQDEGYAYRGDCAEREGDLAAAEEWYTKAVVEASGKPLGYSRLIRLYGRPGRFPTHRDRLLSLVERICALDSSAACGTYLDVASVYRDHQEFDEAHRWIAKAIAMGPSRPFVYFAQGETLLLQKEFDQATAAFQKAIGADAECFDGYWGMALACDDQDRFDEAVHWYEESAKRRLCGAHAIWVRVGMLRKRQGRNEEAEAMFLKALQDEPDDEVTLDMLHGLADVYANKANDPDAALRVYHNRVGNLRFSQRRFHEAAEAYAKAIAAQPARPLYLTNLAEAYRELKEWDRARQQLEAALALTGDRKEHTKQLGLLANAQGNYRYEQGDYRAAAALYDTAVGLRPDDPVLYSNLALAWEHVELAGERLASLDRALAALQKAQHLEPDNQDYARRRQRLTEKCRFGARYGERSLAMKPSVLLLLLDVAADLAELTFQPDGSGLANDVEEASEDVRSWIWHGYGVLPPRIRFRVNGTAPAGSYRALLAEVPVCQGSVSTARRLFSGKQEVLCTHGIRDQEAVNPINGKRASWVDRQDWEKLDGTEPVLWKVMDYPVYQFGSYLSRNLKYLLGHQETAHLLTRRNVPSRDRILASPANLSALVRVLRGLVGEQVSIAALGEICEAFLDLHAAGVNHLTMVERLRALPAVRPSLPGNKPDHRFLELGKGFATAVNRSIWRADSEPLLAMEPELTQDALQAVRTAVQELDGPVAVLVEDASLRPFVRRLVELEFPYLMVLSRQELLPDLQAEFIGEIDLVAP
jgi:tetratricopeptide (TPR) repeat protein